MRSKPGLQKANKSVTRSLRDNCNFWKRKNCINEVTTFLLENLGTENKTS